VTDQPTFDNDTDTVSTCTGACCDPVTLGVEHYRAMSRDPTSFRNGRYIVNMLTLSGPMPDHGTVGFDCKYFDRATRRCVAYDRRPEMCRTFPDTGLCDYCGGRFTPADGTTASPPTPAAPEMTRAEQVKLAAMRTLIRQNSSTAKDRSGRRKRR
jgi:Fe-S-cluster containining protein